MSNARMWMGMCVLVLMLACTVGEAPPEGPGREPGEPAGELPGGDVGARPDAESARASELLVRSEEAYEAAELEEALRLALRVVGEHAGTASEDAARWVAARSAFALGRYAEAQELASEYASAAASSPDAAEARALAELAADALERPLDVVVGVVLPRTGPRVLVRYADWVLEGIELAVAEAERAQEREIELVVADDAGGARVAEAVREVERQGALAIVGPLLPQHMGSAARARSDRDLVLISPTTTEAPRWPEAYSISSSDPRGARHLGRYAADLGLRQAAMLYPRVPEFEQKADAFAAEYEALGGRVRAMIPYDSGTTTFDVHMRRILEAVAPGETRELRGTDYDRGRLSDSMAAGPAGQAMQEPFALFVPAPPRDVPQIAPQIGFYGLDSAGVQIFGDEAWAAASVRRQVPDRDLEGAIAASRFPPDRADAAADPAFVRAYEERYRQSLPNQLPALGYDAAHLVMQALPNRLRTPRAFARRFHLLAGIRGATGLLSVRENRVVRTPYLVIIRAGELVPAPAPRNYELPEPKRPIPADSLEEVG